MAKKYSKYAINSIDNKYILLYFWHKEKLKNKFIAKWIARKEVDLYQKKSGCFKTETVQERRRKKMKKRWLSALLAVSMLLSPSYLFAGNAQALSVGTDTSKMVHAAPIDQEV